MGNPFELIRNGGKEPNAKVSKGAIVRTFSLQVLVNCTCGAPEPILIHFIPGTDLKGLCPGCRSMFVVSRFSFDKAAGNDVKVAVGMIPPNIITPAVGTQ